MQENDDDHDQGPGPETALMVSFILFLLTVFGLYYVFVLK
jgi:hypothetical protein